MSARSLEVRVRGSEKPPLVFESADLKADLRDRFLSESVNESTFRLGATGIETKASFEGKKEIASSILVFWDKFEVAIERINRLTESGAPYQNTDDLTQLKDQEFEMAQIATKILDSNQAFDTHTIAVLQTKVMMAEAIVDSITERVSSVPVSMRSPVTIDAPASGFIDIEILDARDPSDDEVKPGGGSTTGNEVVVLPGEQATNQIELLRPLGDEERRAFEFLFTKFDTQIVPAMSSLVSELNESETEYTTSYVDTFNDVADRIYDLEREISKPTLLASQDEYKIMGQELRELVNQADAQYIALLLEVQNQSAESGSASTADSLSEAGAEIIAYNEALAQAENQLSAIKFALREVQAGPFKLNLDRKQKALMDKALVLLGDESNPNSLAYTLQHLLLAKTRGENIDGNRVQLDNKLATLNTSLGELGRVLSPYMTEYDRQLFTDSIAPAAASSLGAPAAEAAMVALPGVPAEVVKEVKTAPASTETVGQPERISEELFALYKAASHDAIWPPADRSAAMPEKRIGQITNEINAAMAKQGYTRKAITAFYKDKLHAIFSTILVAYRQEKNDEIRAQKLYDSFDELLQNVAAKLNTAPEITPDVAAASLVQVEALPQVELDLPKESDLAVAVSDTSHGETLVTAEDSEAENKQAEIVIEAAAACRAVRDRLVDEFTTSSAEPVGAVKVGLQVIEYNAEQVQQLVNSFLGDDMSLTGSQLLQEIQKRVTLMEETGIYLRSQNEKDITLDDVAETKNGDPAIEDLNGLAFDSGLDINTFLLGGHQVIDAKLNSAPEIEDNKVNEYLDNLVVTEEFNQEVLYGPLPKTINDFDLRVAAIASEYKRILQAIDGAEGDATVKAAIAGCLAAREAFINSKESPIRALRTLIEVAAPFISPYRPYTPSRAEFVARRNRESVYDVYKYPVEAQAPLSLFLKRSKSVEQLKTKIWKLEHEQKQKLSAELPAALENIEKLIAGDNSIDATLWMIRSNHEDGRDSSADILRLQKELGDLDIAIDFAESLLVPPIEVYSAEDIAAQQRKLADLREQVLRLRTYVSHQGAEASPEVQRLLQMIDDAENATESDTKVFSINLGRRIKAIEKILKGEDGQSGPYFTTLSPEERLAMAGLPTTPENSATRPLEDGDAYTETLDAYRAARLRFIGGTRRVGTGTDETLDGSVRRVEVGGVQAHYEQKLHEFYKEAGKEARNGVLNRIKNVFGFKPKLTPELEALRAQYGEAKAEYARALQAVLTVRGARFDTNKAFDTKSAETNQAFGQKFVLDEFRQQQKIQAEALDTPKNETIQKILGVMRKHKWTMRGISVLGAGVIAGGGLAALGIGAAALSGTAAVMGSATAAARIAGVIGFGGVLGKQAHIKFQKGVNAARVDLETAEKGILSDFDVDKMDSSQELLKQGTQRLSAAERTQKVATFAAAVAPGGLLAATSAMEILTGAASEPALAQSFEIDPAVPGRPIMVVEKIDFTGKGVNKGAVPSNEWASLTESTKQKVADLLATRPHLKEVEVESLVLQKLQTEFGNRPWWDDANIDGIDVGIAERAPVPVKGIDMDTEAVPAPAPVPVPSPVAEAAVIPPPPPPPAAPETAVATLHEVKDGDTLSKVTLEKFGGSEIMKGLTPAEQKAAIYELMERAQNKVALRDSIGLRGNDINKIYDGQAIKLDGLEAELKAIVAEGDYKATEVQNQPTRGGLKVSTLDQGVNTLPIKVAALPSDFAADQSLPSPILSERPVLAEVTPSREFVQASYKPLEIPRPYSLSGNYLDTREYRAFVTEVFGSIEKFNRAVDLEVTKFERGHYDALDRLMGTDVYLSPYKEFSNLTMAEIDLKRAELEGMKKEYDTFGGQNIKNPFGEVGQMKYETYRASVERLDQLKREYAWTPSTKLSDFIGRVVAETRAAELAEAKTLLQA